MPLRTALPIRLIISIVILPLLSIPATAQTAVPTATPPSELGTIISAAAVNIRSCPKLDCPVLATARLGDPVTVTGDLVDGFLPVRLGNAAGYAYGLFVATPSRGTPELRQGLPGCQRVAIIFNIGIGYPPDLGVLAWLEANDIPATLFPMGWWAEENPDTHARDGEPRLLDRQSRP